jgi:hypothetical protein
MPGKDPQLSPVEARKQFLRVESEVNRIQLAIEGAELRSRLTLIATEALAPLAKAASLLGQSEPATDDPELPASATDWASRAVRWFRFGTFVWSKLRQRA